VKWEKMYKHLPLAEIPEKAGYHAPWFLEWIEHATYDDYWKSRSVAEHYGDFRVPVLQMGGWYDLFGDCQLRIFEGLQAAGKVPHRLIIGPWGHGLNTRNLGQLDFSPRAVIDIDAEEKRWFDRWLLDKENGCEKDAPLRIFVMGTNVWRDEYE